MRFRVQHTQNGLTVFDEEAGETFKSQHSALTEVEEVFYRPGVEANPWKKNAEPFAILELGFGLGTNFSHLRSKQAGPLSLVSVERDLAGAKFLQSQIPDAALGSILAEGIYREGNFTARILPGDFFEVLPKLRETGEKFHCIYFDPFSPKANPEAWVKELFSFSFDLLVPQGRLVTYSVSRSAKDAAAAAGFLVEKHKLSPELKKRSALLAVKPGSP